MWANGKLCDISCWTRIHEVERSILVYEADYVENILISGELIIFVFVENDSLTHGDTSELEKYEEIFNQSWRNIQSKKT